MKRIFSLFLVICFMFSAGSVFGAGYDKAFDALSNTVYSGEFEMSIKTELNKPLLIAEVMENLLFGTSQDVPVDLKLLLEGLLASELDAECTYNVSKDFQKADFAMSFTSSNPIDINESLKIAAWSKWDMWMQYDFTAEIPVYRIIYKTPVSNKYIVMDMREQLAKSPIETVKNMPDAEQTAAIQRKVISLYKDNSEVIKKSGGYRIKIDDEGFKNIFIGIFDIMAELMNEQFLKLGMTESDITEANAGFKQIKDGFEASKNKFDILGKEGFTIDMKVNSTGYITESVSSVNICLNVYDIMNSLGAESECIEAGITKENSSIDFTIETSEKISKHNQNVKVKYPVLTDENSYNPMASAMYEGDYVSRYKYFSVIEDGVPMVENSVSYVKLRGVAEECGFDLSYDDGIVYVDTKTSDGIVELKTNSNVLTKNGEEIELANLIIERDGTTYVTSETLMFMSAEISSVTYETHSDLTYIYCHYTDPDYVEPEYEYEEEIYVEEGLAPYFWVESTEAPIIKNDVIYVPLYPLMGEFNVATEEINVENGVISISSDNSYIFNTLKIFENSVLAEKDGEKILFDNSALNVNGSYWVGTDFAEKVLNSEFTELYFSGYHTTYYFDREVK